MKIYARSWFVATALATAAGAVLALISLPVSGLVVLALVGAGGGAVDVIASQREHPTGQVRALLVRHADRILMAAALALGAGGWIGALGPSGLLLVIGFAVGAPRVISPFMAFARSKLVTPVPVPAKLGYPRVAWSQHHDEVIRRSMRSRSDHEVLRLWQTSYAVLLGRQSADELHRVISIRRSCLDEFERRYPHGFCRWLPEARASGDPTVYLKAEPEIRPEQ